MSEFLLIGGSARVGKSTLAKEVRSKINGQIVSGDAFIDGIRASLDPEWLPDLFISQSHARDEDFEGRLALLRKRDAAQWRFIKNYLSAAAKDSNDDVLYYGNLWPDYLAELELDYRAVFLVDTSPDRAVFLKSVRDNSSEDSNNWMKERGYSDEKIDQWAEFDIAKSWQIIDLCHTNQISYFDIAVHGISKAQHLAEQYLLGAD